MVSNERELADAMAQLSTGKRINNAADDAAGLAITSRMTAQIRGLDQAVRNAGDGIALLQTIDGATIEITNMLQRMRELAIQASNDSNANAERSFLDLEFQNLSAEINRIAENTQWNGFNILDGTARDEGGWRFQIGANADQTVFVSAIDLRNLIPSSSQAQQGLFEVMSGLQPGQTASVTINGQTFTITGEAAVAQSGEIEVANDLAADDYAQLTIGDQTFTFSGPTASAQGGTAREGVYQTSNNLLAGETATLEINGQIFTVTGAPAEQQLTELKFSSIATPGAMTVDVNGQTFSASGSRFGVMTAMSAATILASEINNRENRAQVTKVGLSTIASNAGLSIAVNGQSFAILPADHGLMTASAAADALAAKINAGSKQQINRIALDDAQVDAGTTASITLNGQSYVVLGNTHSATTGASMAALLADRINGGVSQKQVSFDLVCAAGSDDLTVTLNGETYQYIADQDARVSPASVAGLLAARINGANSPQVMSVSLAGTNPLLGTNFSIQVNGESFIVSGSEHTAVTQASAAALLAGAVNAGQSTVSATAINGALQIHALNAGTEFAIDRVQIGPTTANAVVISPNNAYQTAVSATVSGNALVLTATTPGNDFDVSERVTVGDRSVLVNHITANNQTQRAVSAFVSTDGALVLRALEAGTPFEISESLAMTNQVVKAITLDSAMVGGLKDFSVEVNGRYFVVDRRLDNPNTAASAAELLANQINSGGIAQKTAYELSAVTSTGALTLPIGGHTVSLALSSFPLSTANMSGRYTASMLASVINHDPEVSAQVVAAASTNLRYTLTVPAKAAAGHETHFSVNGVEFTVTTTGTTAASQAEALVSVINDHTTVSEVLSAVQNGNAIELYAKSEGLSAYSVGVLQHDNSGVTTNDTTATDVSEVRLTLSARTVGFSAPAFGDVRLNDTLIGSATLCTLGAHDVSEQVSASVSGNTLVLTAKNGAKIDVGSLAIERRQKLVFDFTDHIPDSVAGPVATLSVNLNGSRYIATTGATPTATEIATLLAAEINGVNSYTTYTFDDATLAAGVDGTNLVNVLSVAGYEVGFSTSAAITVPAQVSAMASVINGTDGLSALVSATKNGNDQLVITAREASAYSFSAGNFTQTQGTTVTVAGTLSPVGNKAQAAVSATVSTDGTLVLTNLTDEPVTATAVGNPHGDTPGLWGTSSTNTTRGGTTITASTITQLTRSIDPVDIAGTAVASVALITANNTAQSAIIASVENGMLVLRALDAGTPFSVTAVNVDLATEQFLELSNVTFSGLGAGAARGASITIAGQKFGVGMHDVASVTTASAAATALATAINGTGEKTRFAYTLAAGAESESVNGNTLFMSINGVLISANLSTGINQGGVAVGATHTAASQALALASAINTNAQLDGVVTARTSGAVLLVSADQFGLKSFSASDIASGVGGYQQVQLNLGAVTAIDSTDALRFSVNGAFFSIPAAFHDLDGTTANDITETASTLAALINGYTSADGWSDSYRTGYAVDADVFLPTALTLGESARATFSVNGVSVVITNGAAGTALTSAQIANNLALAINSHAELQGIVSAVVSGTGSDRWLRIDAVDPGYMNFSVGRLTLSVDISGTAATTSVAATLDTLGRDSIEGISARASGEYLYLYGINGTTVQTTGFSVDNGRLLDRFITSTTVAASATVTDAYTYVVSAIGQGVQSSVTARASGTALILTSRELGTEIDATSLIYGANTRTGDAFTARGTQPLQTITAAGTAFDAVVCTANFAAQSAVSAFISNEQLFLRAATAGHGFSTIGIRTDLGTLSAIELTANDAGGFTANEMLSNMALQVQDTFSMISATASAGTLTLRGADNGALLSAGQLFDGLSTESFIETQAATVGSITASTVAASLAASANAYFSNVSVQAIDGVIRITSLVAGLSIPVAALDDGTSLNAYQAVTAADAGGYTATEMLSILAVNTQDIDGVTTRASGNALIVSATVAGNAFSTGTLNIDGLSAIAFDLQVENADVGYNVKSFDAAQATLEKLDEAMLLVNGERAKMGAVANRLEYSIDNLRNVTMNLQASRSHYEDADYAQATTNLSKHQIIAQAATSVLAQANQSQQNVLTLLNG